MIFLSTFHSVSIVSLLQGFFFLSSSHQTLIMVYKCAPRSEFEVREAATPQLYTSFCPRGAFLDLLVSLVPTNRHPHTTPLPLRHRSVEELSRTTCGSRGMRLKAHRRISTTEIFWTKSRSVTRLRSSPSLGAEPAEDLDARILDAGRRTPGDISMVYRDRGWQARE